MSHSYAENVVHIVFSTKDRYKLISPEFRPRMWSYLAGICRNLDLHVYAIGGMSDHAHLLVRLSATLALAKAAGALKANSSKWAGERGPSFAWQEGYAAFSVSASLVPRVTRYIQAQEAHHKKMSFETELLALLKKHGVQHDPALVFGGFELQCRARGARLCAVGGLGTGEPGCSRGRRFLRLSYVGRTGRQDLEAP